MDGLTPFNNRMREARESAGMTLTDVVVVMRSELPKPMWSSQTTIQRLETTTPEDRAEPMLVAWLARLYGLKTSDLSQIAADALASVRDLVAGNACSGTPA